MEPWSWAGGTCTQEAQRIDAGGSKWRRESWGTAGRARQWCGEDMVGLSAQRVLEAASGPPEFKTSWFRGLMCGEG